jgi:hypothetical protein
MADSNSINNNIRRPINTGGSYEVEANAQQKLDISHASEIKLELDKIDSALDKMESQLKTAKDIDNYASHKKIIFDLAAKYKELKVAKDSLEKKLKSTGYFKAINAKQAQKVESSENAIKRESTVSKDTLKDTYDSIEEVEKAYRKAVTDFYNKVPKYMSPALHRTTGDVLENMSQRSDAPFENYETYYKNDFYDTNRVERSNVPPVGKMYGRNIPSQIKVDMNDIEKETGVSAPDVHRIFKEDGENLRNLSEKAKKLHQANARISLLKAAILQTEQNAKLQERISGSTNAQIRATKEIIAKYPELVKAAKDADDAEKDVVAAETKLKNSTGYKFASSEIDSEIKTIRKVAGSPVHFQIFSVEAGSNGDSLSYGGSATWRMQFNNKVLIINAYGSRSTVNKIFGDYFSSNIQSQTTTASGSVENKTRQDENLGGEITYQWAPQGNSFLNTKFLEATVGLDYKKTTSRAKQKLQVTEAQTINVTPTLSGTPVWGSSTTFRIPVDPNSPSQTNPANYSLMVSTNGGASVNAVSGPITYNAATRMIIIPVTFTDPPFTKPVAMGAVPVTNNYTLTWQTPLAPTVTSATSATHTPGDLNPVLGTVNPPNFSSQIPAEYIDAWVTEESQALVGKLGIKTTHELLTNDNYRLMLRNYFQISQTRSQNSRASVEPTADTTVAEANILSQLEKYGLNTSIISRQDLQILGEMAFNLETKIAGFTYNFILKPGMRYNTSSIKGQLSEKWTPYIEAGVDFHLMNKEDQKLIFSLFAMGELTRSQITGPLNANDQQSMNVNLQVTYALRNLMVSGLLGYTNTTIRDVQHNLNLSGVAPDISSRTIANVNWAIAAAYNFSQSFRLEVAYQGQGRAQQETIHSATIKATYVLGTTNYTPPKAAIEYDKELRLLTAKESEKISVQLEEDAADQAAIKNWAEQNKNFVSYDESTRTLSTHAKLDERSMSSLRNLNLRSFNTNRIRVMLQQQNGIALRQSTASVERNATPDLLVSFLTDKQNYNNGLWILKDSTSEKALKIIRDSFHGENDTSTKNAKRETLEKTIRGIFLKAKTDPANKNSYLKVAETLAEQCDLKGTYNLYLEHPELL